MDFMIKNERTGKHWAQVSNLFYEFPKEIGYPK